MINRREVSPNEFLNGYDFLQSPKDTVSPVHPPKKNFSPNMAYDEYFKMHKVFVGEAGGAKLESIGYKLKDEWLPRYLDAAGWAYAESALTQSKKPNLDRTALLDQAQLCWEKGLRSQQEFDEGTHNDWLSDHTDSLRTALSLAHTPLMRGIIDGDVTEATRELAFADTLAIAQLSVIKSDLASKAGQIDIVADHRGFQYECIALLSILYLNNPNYVPLPSSARAGSGYEYRDQTHDIGLVHQRWGRIHKITPIEIKSAASLRDRKRYKALIVRGKMHLSIEGKYDPRETLEAYAAEYENNSTSESQQIAHHASSTIKDLIVLYQKGGEIESYKKIHSQTKFHATEKIVAKYIEFSQHPRMK